MTLSMLTIPTQDGDRVTLTTLPVITIPTQGGNSARYAVRPDTNDGALAYGIVLDNEYPFRRMQGLEGWAIDIGAHIGIVTVALALDNPDLHVLAVEALAENVAILAENVGLNGLGERVSIYCAAAGDGTDQDITHGYVYNPDETDEANKLGGYVQQSRFIGAMYAPREGMVAETRTVPGLSLSSLMERMSIDRVALLKLDCEGCEWAVLTDPAIERVDRIVGEFHGQWLGHPGLTALQLLLEETHEVTQLDDNPVNGIFWAERR